MSLHKPCAVSDFEAYRNIQKKFEIRIVQISGWGRTLHLTKDMNDLMVEFDISVKGESWHFAKKQNTARYVCKGCHINLK